MSIESTANIRGQIKATESVLTDQRAILALLEKRDSLAAEIADMETRRAWFEDEIHRATITLETKDKFDEKELLFLAENAFARGEVEHLASTAPAGLARARNFKVDFLRSRKWIPADQVGNSWRDIPGAQPNHLDFAFEIESRKGLDAARLKFLPAIIEKATISRKQRQPAAVA